ncbi:MAG: restriction endonuclease subunit R, partial [Gemmatimonadetes bacterium]|nr:restriction endonuclease subunit R [Gemmatimonadota bacterium]
SAFADAVGECLGPVENPRYLVTRPRHGILGKKVDYHAVPRLLGRDKERALVFLSHWNRHVGPGSLIYTRREGGRRALLAARGRAFANNHPDAGVRVDRWQ